MCVAIEEERGGFTSRGAGICACKRCSRVVVLIVPLSEYYSNVNVLCDLCDLCVCVCVSLPEIGRWTKD